MAVLCLRIYLFVSITGSLFGKREISRGISSGYYEVLLQHAENLAS